MYTQGFLTKIFNRTCISWYSTFYFCTFLYFYYSYISMIVPHICMYIIFLVGMYILEQFPIIYIATQTHFLLVNVKTKIVFAFIFPHTSMYLFPSLLALTLQFCIDKQEMFGHIPYPITQVLSYPGTVSYQLPRNMAGMSLTSRIFSILSFLKLVPGLQNKCIDRTAMCLWILLAATIAAFRKT